MRFVAADRLWLLLAVAAVAVTYVVLQVVGRRRYAVRFTNVALLGSVAPKRPGWRRHVPAALLLLALCGMAVSLARPARPERVPRERATVIMAIDVSISMDATDVAPTRLEAAKAAATSFAKLLPRAINLGLVSFAGTATVLVPPTTDRSLVIGAISRLQLAEATAIGEAVLASLDAIKSVPPAADGKPAPSSIVLMSDGETTAGTPNDVAAEQARKLSVPVTTIAFGTDHGTIEYQGEVVDVPVNDEKLAELASETNGRTFRAATGEQLRSVYQSIGSSIGFERQDKEVGSWFVGAAFLLALAAACASLAWFSRLP